MKTIKLFYKISVIFILSGLLNACEKDPIFLSIDQESKDYYMFFGAFFERERYWIYQDSVTLKIDSVVVSYNSSQQHSFESRENCYFYDEYSAEIKYFLLKSFHKNGSYLLTTIYCNMDDAKKDIIKPILNKSVGGIDPLYIDMASPYFNYHNGSLYERFNGLLYENYHESYQIENNTFSKVKVFLYSFPNQSYQIRTYWAKNVGIIRTEYIGENGNTFAVRNLIRYSIKPYNQ